MKHLATLIVSCLQFDRSMLNALSIHLISRGNANAIVGFVSEMFSALATSEMKEAVHGLTDAVDDYEKATEAFGATISTGCKDAFDGFTDYMSGETEQEETFED